MVVLAGLAVGVWWISWRSDEAGDATGSPTPTVAAGSTSTSQPAGTPTPLPTPTAAPTPTPYPGWVDPTSSGSPWGTEVDGLLTFRGNPTRTFYGSGPVPTAPTKQWWYPDARTMCGSTSVGGKAETWCGTGWTGQPAVFEREGRTWVVFGAFDYGVHFVDADTGRNIIPTFFTDDIIKGSVTIDPDGYPLVYTGSRDNYLRILSFDGDQPVELWRLHASEASGTKWNDDWDGTPMILDDYLFEGGENSIFHIVKLNRGYDESGKVTVDPEIVFQAPGYDDELLRAVGSEVSIEGSVAVSGNTVYFANSGGLVQGWDITELADGVDPTRVFRYWVGEDVDATIVIDEEGMLYVGVEYEKGRARANEVGQIVKLDPTRPDDPLVWSVFDNGRIPAGAWATPALYRDLVIEAVQSGWVLGLDRDTGEERWRLRMPGPFNWSSPVVVDDVLIMGDCNGTLHAYDLRDTTIEPPELWQISLGSCIESTPAVWDGRIIVAVRGGQMYMLSDAPR